MASAWATGDRIWDSREAGPPPRTSSPAGLMRSQRSTVQPVAASSFWACPTRNPPTSIIPISFMATSLPLQHHAQGLADGAADDTAHHGL